MILPTKHLPESRSLIAIGGDVLRLLSEPKTVSRVWEELKRKRASQPDIPPISYDWFVLALDFLCALNAVELDQGRLRRIAP